MNGTMVEFKLQRASTFYLGRQLCRIMNLEMW